MCPHATLGTLKNLLLLVKTKSITSCPTSAPPVWPALIQTESQITSFHDALGKCGFEICKKWIQNHWGWKKDHRDHYSPTTHPPPLCPRTASLSATSPCSPNTPRDGDSTDPRAAYCNTSSLFLRRNFPDIQSETYSCKQYFLKKHFSQSNLTTKTAPLSTHPNKDFSSSKNSNFIKWFLHIPKGWGKEKTR